MNVQTRPQDVIFLTGASTGLGLSIAKLLMKQNCHLILTARKTSLHRFQENNIKENDNLWIRALDVTQHDQRVALIDEINLKLNGVTVLINNAGFSTRSVIEHTTEQDHFAQMQTNFHAPMELTRLILPQMRKKKSGKIINISSVSGMMAMPTMGAYSASKWALEGASESLWYEVKPWGISVTLIQPGFINSESFKNVLWTSKSNRSCKSTQDPYHNHYNFMAKFIKKLMGWSPSTSEQVAKKVLAVMKNRNSPLRVSGTIDAFLFSHLRRWLPRTFYHLALYASLPGVTKWGSPTEYNKLQLRNQAAQTEIYL
jgi:short-subunit dehydrogenase